MAVRAICPKCGGMNISYQTFQENRGGASFTRTTARVQETEEGHGCLWWMLIGWWWWIFKLSIWLVLLVPRMIGALLTGGGRAVGTATSASVHKNMIRYTTIAQCNDCGYHWETKGL